MTELDPPQMLDIILETIFFILNSVETLENYGHVQIPFPQISNYVDFDTAAKQFPIMQHWNKAMANHDSQIAAWRNELINVDVRDMGLLRVAEQLRHHKTVFDQIRVLSSQEFKRVFKDSDSTIEQVESCIRNPYVFADTWYDVADIPYTEDFPLIIMRKGDARKETKNGEGVPVGVNDCALVMFHGPETVSGEDLPNYPLCPISFTGIGVQESHGTVDKCFAEYWYYIHPIVMRKQCFTLESIDKYRNGKETFVDPINRYKIIVLGALVKIAAESDTDDTRISSKVKSILKELMHAYSVEYPWSAEENVESDADGTDADVIDPGDESDDDEVILGLGESDSDDDEEILGLGESDSDDEWERRTRARTTFRAWTPGGASEATTKKYTIPHQRVEQKKRLPPTLSRKPRAAVRESNLILSEVFTLRAKGEHSKTEEDIRREIQEIINFNTVTVDMVIAYTLFGAAECKEGVVIVDEGEVGDYLLKKVDAVNKASQSGVLQPVSYALMNQNMTLVKGDLIIDLNSLRKASGEIVRDILKNEATVRRLGEHQIFKVISRDIRGGNDVSDAESEYYTPEGYPEGSPSDGNLPLAPAIDRSEDTIDLGYGDDLLFMSSRGQSFSKRGERLVMKISFWDGRLYRHVVVKAALTAGASENIDTEATMYTTLKSFFNEFYSENVLQILGNGNIEDGNVRFGFKEKKFSLSIYGNFERRAYIVTEYNPDYVNLQDLLQSKKRVLGNHDYAEFTNDLMQVVLDVHKHANSLCEFGHGDLKVDNVLINTQTGNAILYDLEYASISGYISNVFELYGNEYMMRVKRGDVLDFDAKYLWYFDATRFILSLVFEGHDFDTTQNFQYSDPEVEDLYRILAHFVEITPNVLGAWNGYLQSHEFVNQIINSVSKTRVHR